MNSISLKLKEKISYNDYYKMKYKKTIENQTESLMHVEKAHLIGVYSIYVKPEEKKIEEDKTSSFSIYLPKELCIISPITKSLYR